LLKLINQLCTRYKPGEKKSIKEYEKLDQEDNSLNRWKASLGIGQGVPLPVPPEDERTVVICKFILVVPDRPDFVVDVEDPETLKTLSEKPICIKEGSHYSLKVMFRVQHEIISGLKYIQHVKRKRVPVTSAKEMMGSYMPNTHEKPIYEKKFAEEIAPSGMLLRGHYSVHVSFVDDDKRIHQTFDWTFEIKKDWE